MRFVGTYRQHMHKEWKEVKRNVAILTIRSHSSRGTWPCRHCILPIDITIDCRTYARVITKEQGHGTIMIGRSRKTKGVIGAELNRVIRHRLERYQR